MQRARGESRNGAVERTRQAMQTSAHHSWGETGERAGAEQQPEAEPEKETEQKEGAARLKCAGHLMPKERKLLPKTVASTPM